MLVVVGADAGVVEGVCACLVLLAVVEVLARWCLLLLLLILCVCVFVCVSVCECVCRGMWR